MKKILIVEDDKSISTALSFSFKKEGFNVDAIGTAAEARKLIFEELFDIIIMDVGLPDGDGFEVSKYIRSVSEVPIVFLTARDEKEYMYRGFEIGGDDYITKPFSFKELYLRVNSILRRNETNDMKKIRVSGDIRIDTSSVRVYKKDTILDLTPTEYKLLNFFFDNSKNAMTREDILKNIWETNQDLKGDNTISVYIKRLREKIEDEVNTPDYIKTVRNVGYIWDKDVT